MLQSLKLLRNPWGTAGTFSRLNNVINAISDSGFFDLVGNINPVDDPPKSHASRKMAIACADSGTRCSRRAFIRAAGTVHNWSFQSISAHVADLTSPLDAAQRDYYWRHLCGESDIDGAPARRGSFLTSGVSRFAFHRQRDLFCKAAWSGTVAGSGPPLVPWWLHWLYPLRYGNSHRAAVGQQHRIGRAAWVRHQSLGEGREVAFHVVLIRGIQQPWFPFRCVASRVSPRLVGPLARRKEFFQAVRLGRSP